MQKTGDRRRPWLAVLALTGWTLVIILAVKLIPRTSTGDASQPRDAKSLYAASADAVFYVRSLDANEELQTSGSGFTIQPGGLALTAAHVTKKAELIHVVLASGEEVADVAEVYHDDEFDISILRLPEREGGYAFLSLEGGTPAHGEAAYAIGYPLKTVKLVADGIVASPESNINETPRMLITNDLASGMSGGPIVCASGTVIGISSATLRTMNGVSVSPTTAQIRQAVDPYVKAAGADLPDDVETPEEAKASAEPTGADALTVTES